MPTVRLRHVNPLGAVEYPAIGRVGTLEDYPDPGAGPVKPGELVDVDESVAGSEPGRWRDPTDAERAEGLRGLVTREHGQAPNVRTQVLCPGRGLLGTGAFERVDSKATREHKGE